MKFSSPKTVRIPSMKLVIGRSAQMSLELLLREGAGGEDIDTGRVVQSRAPLVTLLLHVAAPDTISWQPPPG